MYRLISAQSIYRFNSFQRRMYTALRLGVDEAGHGAVMGPLVISSVLLDDESEKELQFQGVKDSKQLSPEKRFHLYDQILERAKRSCSIHISSITIDKQRQLGLSMNRIEENHIFTLLKKYVDDPVDEVVIDAFVSKQNRLYNEICKLFPSSMVRCEFHADATYPVVACASVIAKVERDRAMISLSQELGRDLGSGYPHDELSTSYIREFVKEHGKPPTIARSSWLTTQRIVEEVLRS